MIDDEDFKIEGPATDENPYLEKMIRFWKKTKKNLYQFLLTLEINDLILMCNEIIEEKENDSIKEEGKYSSIGKYLAITAYSIEKAKDTAEFTATFEDFSKAVNSFAVMCSMAASEKMGDIKITDTSYFYDPQHPFKIELINENMVP